MEVPKKKNTLNLAKQWEKGDCVVNLPIICAMSREMRIKSTKKGSNGGVWGAECVPVNKAAWSVIVPSGKTVLHCFMSDQSFGLKTLFEPFEWLSLKNNSCTVCMNVLEKVQEVKRGPCGMFIILSLFPSFKSLTQAQHSQATAFTPASAPLL